MRWYNLTALVKYLHSLQDFITRTVGKLPESYAPALDPSTCPASQHTRFPADAIYVCEGIGAVYGPLSGTLYFKIIITLLMPLRQSP